jgi:hypothetical protein
VLAAILAGSTAAAFIGDRWGVAVVALAAPFFLPLPLALVIRAFRSNP